MLVISTKVSTVLVRLNRFLTANRLRELYEIPDHLWEKLKVHVPIAFEDGGKPYYLESSVDEFLRQLGRKVAAGGRPDTTREIAVFADGLKAKGSSWKAIFEACKRRWPDDPRVQLPDQVRRHWRALC